MLTLHHIGHVVPDIAAASGIYRDRLGYEVVTQIIHDPLQQAFVRFLRLPGDRVFLELVSPDTPASGLQRALDRELTLHHLCYAVADIQSTLASLRSKGMSLVKKPLPAVAFRGNLVAWVMGRDRLLVELVELANPDSPLAFSGSNS
jgi:methylmalonyl-CoA/ethylmalonyl-CoA epimerase